MALLHVIPVGVMITRTFPNRTGLANSVVISGMSPTVGDDRLLAAVLVTFSWQSVFILLGAAHLLVIPFSFGQYRRCNLVRRHRVLSRV